MQYQSCTSNTAFFEEQGSDGVGFRSERNIVKSDGFYYGMKYSVQLNFTHYMGIIGK
jgi:hypothetical protein